MNFKQKKIVFISFLSFFTVILGVCLGLAIAVTVNTINTENFDDFQQALPTKILDINGEVITDFAADEKREIITLDRLPPHMINALLTREDQVFYKHKGFRIKAIVRAVIGQLSGDGAGGGSTITQQIAGTLYCDRTEQSIVRKLKELWWAIQMERRYSKDEILETYLNKIYFGCGTYGVNAASKYYFGHSAEEITPAEAALLVIQLSNPAYYNPFEHTNRAMERQQYVLESMVALNYLTQEEYQESFDNYWAGFDYTRISSSAYYSREDKAPWFSEYVLRELKSKIYGTDDVFTSGFTVYTTMNLKHQKAAEEILTRRIDFANRNHRQARKNRKSADAPKMKNVTEVLSLICDIPPLHLTEVRTEKIMFDTFSKTINPIIDVTSLMFGMNDLQTKVVKKTQSIIENRAKNITIEGTLICLENETGYITAIVGGSKFDSENQFIRATQAKVQPGSTFKPLYYSAGIDSKKYTTSTIMFDGPIVIKTAEGVPYMPKNYSERWYGNVPLWKALACSYNIPALQILEGIGFDAAINRSVALLGIPQNEVVSRGFLRVYPLGLGVCSVRPIELARAYAIFANGGKEVTPIAIRYVENSDGSMYLEPERELRLEQKRKGDAIQVISPQNAFLMTEMLKQSVRIGTLTRDSQSGAKFTYKTDDGKKYTLPSAGKSGTTQDWADSWVVGYTPYLTTAVWFGFDKLGIETLGKELSEIGLAGPVWADFMKIANEDYPMKNFQIPKTGIQQATVCRSSGLLPTAACKGDTYSQYFLTGTVPTTYCEYHADRANAKAIGKDRLKEAGLSVFGDKIYSDDDDLFNVDLDFLDDNEEYPTNTNTNSLFDDVTTSFLKDLQKKLTTTDKENSTEEEETNNLFE